MDQTAARIVATAAGAGDNPNQAPALEGYNLYTSDLALQEAVRRAGAGWAEAWLADFGERLGRAETIALGAAANRSPPVLHTHDRFGNRRDEVEFHPAYHELMALGFGAGLHASPWAEPREAAHAARAAAYILYGQVESGTQCPMTMTYASIAVLAKHAATLPGVQDVWLPRLYARQYDKRFAPIRSKTGAAIGMGMTEKQGGSDVRSNTSRAEPAGRNGAYRITGHKWFFSAPMCDAFLVLAQAPGGLTCFFLPRLLDDGSRNALRLVRLKDKLGNRSNASAEVEFDEALAWRVGEEGRGVATIIEMVNYTRLDCATGSSGLMRQALVQAIHHARHRAAFGRRLVEQPLMRNVLADLALESEAATALALRLASAYDRAEAHEQALRRLLTPAAKYWICKRLAPFAQEAMEALGGNGYIEDSIMPRIYREAPVNSIWEGSGNVMCLDVMRAASRNGESVLALFDELDAARGGDARLDEFAAALRRDLEDPAARESVARRLTERIALAIQGALLVRHAPKDVADAFCASRLQGDAGACFGTLSAGTAFQRIIDRAFAHA
ncbi:MAG: acyl-CoA dehydrogenase family protein [Burkholderiaceae bacterium]